MKIADKKALQRYLENLKRAREIGGANPFETKEEKAKRIEGFKKDYRKTVAYYFPHYASAPTPDFHVDFANMVAKDPMFKGGAEWGRGLAKSVVVNITLPFWLWLKGEPIYLVLVSINSAKAKQLLSDLQAELEANPRIIADFGDQKLLGSWEDGFFISKSGIIGQALGAGQSVRGLRVRDRRPTICVVDDLETKDLVKNPKRQDELANWIERDLIPTMDGSPARFVQANNRFAPRMIQTILQERHRKWRYHHIKAYDKTTYEPAWKGKYTADYYRNLEDPEKGIGILAALAEFAQEPQVEGKIFTEELFVFDSLPRIDHFEHIVGHWDVAYAGTSTSDYNAVRVWGLYKKRYYLIDCFVKQSKMKAPLEWMAQYQNSLPASATVYFQYESQFWNDELERNIREVEEAFGITLNLGRADRPKTNKFDRIMSLHPYFQNNRIVFNTKLKALNDFQTGLFQLKGIEPGYSTKDDAPDADEAAIKYLSRFAVMQKSRHAHQNRSSRKY